MCRGGLRGRSDTGSIVARERLQRFIRFDEGGGNIDGRDDDSVVAKSGLIAGVVF